MTNIQLIRAALVYIGPLLLTWFLFGSGWWVGAIMCGWITYLLAVEPRPNWIIKFIHHGKL
jgi:hypothetical protein